MHTELYLDTARLGRMCPSARRAEQDFAGLASQAGCSLYFERFLVNGFGALPRQLQVRAPQLRTWPGIAGLKQRIRSFLGLPGRTPVLLAGRSAHLMRLAAHCLCRHSHNVFTTDAEWPPYLDVLKQVARQHRRTLQIIPLQSLLLEQHITSATIAEYLVAAYKARDCDGVFLSDISFLGWRLPTHQFLEHLSKCYLLPRFVVIDGAQALNHAPPRLPADSCDIFLAGTHKWLRAYLPLSIACAASKSSHGLIDDTLRQCRHDGLLEDPLLDFCSAAQQHDFRTFGETVNVTPMITAAAALDEAINKSRCIADRWQGRLANVRRLVDLLPSAQWRHINVCQTITTGAVLAQARSADTRSASPQQLRSHFHSKGICLSTYTAGMVRISLPSAAFSNRAASRIHKAFSCL